MRAWTFIVHGIAQPQGSTRSFRAGGKIVTTSDNPKVRPWRQAIAWEARAHGVVLSRGEVEVEVRVLLPRPKSHFGKRGLLPSARPSPTTKPDVDKLLRAVLDALTGVAYHDDSQVVRAVISKAYCSMDFPTPIARISVWAGDEDADR